MLFKVKCKRNGLVYTVYYVRQALSGSNCEFLIYGPLLIDSWVWVKANEFTLVE